MAIPELYEFVVLHTRSFRNTSLLVDILCEEYGRLRLVARSARGPKSRYRGLLQPFFLLQGAWRGKGDMYSLVQAELLSSYCLPSDRLVYGFYINELLVKLLETHNAYPVLFHAYKNCLKELSQGYHPWISLRSFEKKLLTEIGYGVSFTHQAFDKGDIVSNNTYRYHREIGFAETSDRVAGPMVFNGSSILAIAQERWDEINVTDKRDISRLMKLLIADVLGYKAINSRSLWVS